MAMDKNKVIITNDNLDIVMVKNKTQTTKNMNKDILHNLDIGKNLLDIGTFESYYSYIKDKLKQPSEVACRIVLSSDLCFSHRIPPFEINTKNNIDLSKSLNDVDKTSKELLKSDIITTYYCDENEMFMKDLLSACLYHFTCSGYLIKQCPMCKNFFLEKNKRIQFCSDVCRKKHNSNKEMQRRKDNPIVALDKKIRDMFSVRGDMESEAEFEKYTQEYSKLKKKLNDDNLLKWLKEQHNNYLRRKKDN